MKQRPYQVQVKKERGFGKYDKLFAKGLFAAEGGYLEVPEAYKRSPAQKITHL